MSTDTRLLCTKLLNCCNAEFLEDQLLNLDSVIALVCILSCRTCTNKCKKNSNKKACLQRLTLQVCASHKLEDLVDEDDGEGELQHHDPLLRVQVRQLEDHLRAEQTDGARQSKRNQDVRGVHFLKIHLGYNAIRRHNGATYVRFFALRRYHACSTSGWWRL